MDANEKSRRQGESCLLKVENLDGKTEWETPRYA